MKNHVEDASLAILKPDPQNARKHNPRNVGMIERSVGEVGFGRSIVAAADGTIIAGNATADALASAGFEDAIVVHTRGDRAIIHIRDDLVSGSQQATKLALYDNRAAELAEWDVEVLQDLVDTDVLPGLFTDAELDRILSDAQGNAPAELDTSSQMQGLEYRIVVECANEEQQAAFLSEFQGRGIPARALIS